MQKETKENLPGLLDAARIRYKQCGTRVFTICPHVSPHLDQQLQHTKLLFFLSDGEIFPAMLLRVSLLLLNFWWFSACLCFLAEFRRMGWVFLDPGPLSPFPVPTPGAVQHCSSAVPPAAVAGGQSHPREGCCVET